MTQREANADLLAEVTALRDRVASQSRQHEDGEGHWRDDPPDAPFAGGPGHRVNRRTFLWALIVVPCLTLIAGCAYGPVYWTRYDATPDLFHADDQQCFNVATISAGFGSAAAYKSCMGEKGWIRVQARGSQPVPEPHFQGPEDDAEFTPVSSTRQRQ